MNNETLYGKKNLMFFAHPDDELAILGLISHLYPTEELGLVWVTNGDSNTNIDRTAESKNALALLGIENLSEFWNFSQKSIDKSLLNKDYQILREINDSITDKISSFNPSHVFTCAFEGGNPTHDLINFFIHQTLLSSQYINGGITGIEFPQYHLEDGIKVFGRFYSEDIVEHENHPGIYGFHLSEETLTKKIKTRNCYKSQKDFFKELGKSAWEELAEIEVFRRIPRKRDYTIKPKEGIYYEEHGRKRVEKGKYKQFITFQDFKQAVSALK